jgi:hypothetical protein
MGFVVTAELENGREFELPLATIQPVQTKIKITRQAYGPN